MIIRALIWSIFAAGWISAIFLLRAGIISIMTDHGAITALVVSLLTAIGVFVPLGFLFDARVAQEKALLDSPKDEQSPHSLDSAAKYLRERSGL